MSKFFTLAHTDTLTKARAGILHTSHGDIETPVFMPVGTQAAVKAIDRSEIENMGYRLILSNTYHLYLRPGVEAFKRFGGLHSFMKWNGAILTDSGGYQVFSLHELRKITENGVKFKSHIDGSRHEFTPENVIETQRWLGSDIVMPLDECIAYPSTFEEVHKSMKLTLRWAERARKAFDKTQPVHGHEQFLFSIVQGGVFPELRKLCAQKMVEIGFDGYAIGGLSVGEPAEEMYANTNATTDILPEDKPRYLMGVGTPENILESIERGIDMFDCVIPTRNARNGQLFTTRGKINIRNNKYQYSDEPLDEGLDNFFSQHYTLGYLRHLLRAGEILGLMIATNHNLAFYKWLTATARKNILDGSFNSWKNQILENIS
jgi:queuine tRNA-ribosyltransferase